LCLDAWRLALVRAASIAIMGGMTAVDTDAPDLDFAGRTPYVAYTEADVLQRLVHPQTDEPLEVTFVVATQIMELHFTLLIHEFTRACERLAADDLGEALAALHRAVVTQKSLVSSWQLLSVMSPVQYNRFRSALGRASGFQSFSYRQLEFLLGAKNENMLHPHAGMPAVHAALVGAYDAPSVYDRAVELLARRGLDVAAHQLGRDVRQPRTEADAGLVELWRQVYQRGDQLTELAEALTAVAEQHSTWRFVHYTAVRRILGAKPGTGGSAGMAWLKRTVDQPVFIDLWEVRGVL
jgi:tryptophan 2,3-dioxygenase